MSAPLITTVLNWLAMQKVGLTVQLGTCDFFLKQLKLPIPGSY